MPLNRNSSDQKGVGLVEALLAVLVISTLIFMYSNITVFLNLTTFTKNKIHAYELAQEEIESLRHIDFSSLTNRTDGAFLNVAYNKGSFEIVQDGAENVYELKSTGAGAGPTGVAIIPGGDYDNFVFEIDVKLLSDSPVNSEAGFYFRYQDKNNFYRLTYTSTGLDISKSLEGVETQVFTGTGYAEDNWATYKIDANDSNFEIFRNAASLGTFSDSSFTRGKIALLGENSAHIYFDKAKINTSLITNGDFNTPTLQNLPDGWQRLGLNDLPQGTGKLTIQDHDGNAEIKDIIVEVEWKEGNLTKSIILQSLISLYGIHS